MASITITVQSLLNTAVYNSYTIDNGQTVAQLKTAIQTATGVNTSWFGIVQNQRLVTNESATLASLGIVAGTQLRTANQIANLATLEDRQKAKLNLAALDRTASGNPRDDYDLSELPTQYYGNEIINNNNADGLVIGRPWITGSSPAKYADGLYGRSYTGYFNDVPTWFATAVQTAAAATTTLVIPVIPVTTSIQLLGYFLPRASGTYTFYTTSDDASYLWIGSNAVSGFTTANAIVNNGGLHGDVEASGTIALTAGTYYPIRVQAGNNQVTGDVSVAFAGPGISKTSNFSDFIFYNTNTNGL